MDDEPFKLLLKNPNDALRLIIRKHGAQLKAYFEMHGLEEEVVKDFIQEVLLVLWEQREKVALQNNPFVWMLGVARMKVKDWRRKEGVIPPTSSVERDKIYIQSTNGADDYLMEQELLEEFIRATDKLTPKEKQVLIDAKLKGMSVRELADVHGVSIQRAKNLVSNAMKKIRGLMSSR